MGKLIPFRRSLSTRLLLVFVIASIILTLLAVFTLMHGFSSAWRVNARPHLELYLDYISEDIGNPPQQENAFALSEKLPVHIYINGPNTQYSTNGEQLELDALYFSKRGNKNIPRFPRKGGALSDVEFGGDEERTLLKRNVGDYQVYYELSHRGGKTERRRFMIPALGIMLACLAVLYLIIRRMLLPVRDIRQGVIAMGQGKLDHRIVVRRDNDLGSLAGSINTMASDIESMLDSKRQLLLGASHELRSPLTRATIATQLLPESKQQKQISDDLQEMEKLIADILESERMKSAHASLDRETVKLQELIESVLREMQVDNVQVYVPTSLPPISVDRTRFGIMLRNLVSNAITHSQTDTPNQSDSVKISVSHSAKFVDVLVSDNGPGIAPEHIEKVTEPFYRTDASRTRQTGGVGLGLHLAKLIAQAHGGSLTIHSKTQEPLTQASSVADAEAKVVESATGTSVIVKLPINV